MKHAGFKLSVLAATALACCGVAPAADYPNDNQSFDQVARGRYLTVVADCGACHTNPGGKLFAGGRKIPTPFGDLTAPNITPDLDTGIGKWSDEEFYSALHNGYSDQHLYPAMPYTSYTMLTRRDVMAIRAYLNTVPSVNNEVHSDTLPFPFNIRASMIGWDWLFFSPGEWKANPKKSAEWNRGGYLVEGAGHCTSCHTAKTLLGADQSGKHLQGGALQGWFAPDITNDKRVGLSEWTVDDIVEYLKTGANRYTWASGPMAEEIRDSSSQWTLSDLKAAATYLKDQPGGNPEAPKALAANDPRMKAGEAIYVDQCSACHTMGGNGIQRMFPTLKGSPFVQSVDPASLLQVVLNGTRTVSTGEEPTGPAMPAFGWKLSNDEVAAVTTYVRNAWGNAASPVSSGDVSSARDAGNGD